MNKFYESYWSEKSGYLYDFSLKWSKLKQFIPKEEKLVIVDFGCGNGVILKEIQKLNPYAHLIGLDVSGAALEKAKDLLPNVEFHKIGDGEKLPLESQSVDFVFSSEVIEHIYDTEKAFSELARILKHGGWILLTTPEHNLLKNILITLFVFDKHFDPSGPHIRFFSKKSLFNLLKKYNFKIIKYGYYGRFYPISHSIFVLAKKINRPTA